MISRCICDYHADQSLSLICVLKRNYGMSLFSVQFLQQLQVFTEEGNYSAILPCLLATSSLRIIQKYTNSRLHYLRVLTDTDQISCFPVRESPLKEGARYIFRYFLTDFDILEKMFRLLMHFCSWYGRSLVWTTFFRVKKVKWLWYLPDSVFTFF